MVRDGQVAETVTSAARVLWIEPDQVSDLEREMQESTNGNQEMSPEEAGDYLQGITRQ